MLVDIHKFSSYSKIKIYVAMREALQIGLLHLKIYSIFSLIIVVED